MASTWKFWVYRVIVFVLLGTSWFIVDQPAHASPGIYDPERQFMLNGTEFMLNGTELEHSRMSQSEHDAPPCAGKAGCALWPKKCDDVGYVWNDQYIYWRGATTNSCMYIKTKYLWGYAEVLAGILRFSFTGAACWLTERWELLAYELYNFRDGPRREAARLEEQAAKLPGFNR